MVIILALTTAIISIAIFWVHNRQDKPSPERKKTYTILATSDIACSPEDPDFNNGNGANGRCEHKAVVGAMNKEAADLVILMGDIDQAKGELESYRGSFIPAYKQLNHPIMAVPGNHDYTLGNADGYKQAFKEGLPSAQAVGKDGKTYHSKKLGNWTIIGLDSNCEYVGGCNQDSEQARWLDQELNNNTACSISFWHHVRYTSALHQEKESTERAAYFWEQLYKKGNDLVVSGHDHNYQRFGQMDGKGNLLEGGMQQIISGTGGFTLRPYNVKSHPSLQKGIDTTFGFTKLILYENHYEWQFVDTKGNVLDNGSNSCY